VEIHKPRPWHGLREFLKEYGIIVLGVLTALAAEQGVHTLQQRADAGEARATIRSELEFDMARLHSRLDTRTCVERRIEEIQALLDGAADRPSIVTPAWIGRPQFWTIQSSRWQAVAQAGHAALMPPDELTAYGMMYAQGQNIFNDLVLEQGDWARLRALEHLRTVTPAAHLELLTALQDARYRHWRITLSTRQMDGSARRLGLRSVANPLPAAQTICLPMDTPRAEVIRRTPNDNGEP
jgi:hypothetical protein